MLIWGFILLGIIIVYFINVIWIEESFRLTIGEYLGSVLFGSMLGGFILMITCMILSFSLPQEWVFSSDNKLYALQDNNGIQGSFYLGTGYINSALQYNYAVKNGDVVHIYHNSTDCSDLIFTKDEPHVISYVSDYKNKFIKNNIPLFNNNQVFCQFYIPKGTIKNNYNVDLK